MAEIAGFHVERMIPELEQIRRLNLFTQDELAEIIKKRKEYEYKVERSKKEKDDFLSYIRYEVKLLRAIKLRRDKFRIFEKKDEIEYAITKRVIKFYKMALLYFKSDYELWLSYINFCTQTKFMNAVSEAFKNMLQVHSDKIHLWKHAAKWEVEEMKNIEGAINILKLGLHHHPNSKELYTEAFSLELQSVNAEKEKTVNFIISEEDDKSNKEAVESRAEIMFTTSLKPIGDDVEYIVSLLEIATKYDFTKNLQNTIIKYLTENCWKHELMWHTMAVRELHGKHYEENKGNFSRIQLCLAVYKSAIKVVPTSLMWEKYLDTVIDVYNKKKNLKNTLLQVLEEAFQAGFLLEKHYKIWVDLYDNDDEQKRIDILTKATTALPQSVNLWIARIRLYIELKNEENIWSVSKEAINILKDHSLPIYKLLIQYSTLIKVHNFAEIKSLFDEGIKKEPAISLELRPMYLEWLCLVKNIKVARQEYEKIAHYMPHCLELHKKMIYLEMGKQGTIAIHLIRNIHQLACQQFGENRTDIWLDYIQFELINKPENVAQIYNDAKNTLHKDYVDRFISEYALLK